MLIALLAVIGVDLAVVVALLIGVLARRRWVNQRSGAFAGAIRVTSGKREGLGPEWRRGYGRWVRDVFVWTKKPFLFRNELVAVDRLEAVRPAREDEITRLGDDPVVAELAAEGAVIQVAAHGKHRALVLGPYAHRGPRAEPSAGSLADSPSQTRSSLADASQTAAATGSNRQEDSR